MKRQAKYIEADQKPLKDVYPQIEQRSQYAQLKLKNCVLKNPCIIRIEPINKYFKQGQKSRYITLLVQGTTLMAQINAYVHKKLKLSCKTALFLTCGKHLVCNRKCVSQIAQFGKQEDHIIYIGYADQDPFG